MYTFLKYLEMKKKYKSSVIFCQIWSININVDSHKLLFEKVYLFKLFTAIPKYFLLNLIVIKNLS